MREYNLKNKIKTCIKENVNTPRIALTLNFSIVEPEKKAGLFYLMNRLLIKGTEKYSSEELASILEENAIDLSTEYKQDYVRFRFVALNEDFELALSILSDIIQHSTFKEFEKEKIKLKGELTAELDSAKIKVSDLFTKTIFKGHVYGNSYTKILEEIDSVTFDDVVDAYKNLLENSKKILVIVGDTENINLENSIKKYVEILPDSKDVETNIKEPNKIMYQHNEIIKEDAQQAQIIQGWLVPTLRSDDYAKMMLLNVILGASGLSSRLFLELREKKGLAYTVRSSYEPHGKSAVFSIYIGTEPSNIQTSIQGFKNEIEKIKKIPVSVEELKNAKNNIIGKQQFITETNMQQANLIAYYMISGLPANYQIKVIENIKQLTSEDILKCAKQYFNENYVVSIIKPTV